jgi:hypothetical protein
LRVKIHHLRDDSGEGRESRARSRESTPVVARDKDVEVRNT